MEKEKVLEIKVVKMNEEYSVFCITHQNEITFERGKFHDKELGVISRMNTDFTGKMGNLHLRGEEDWDNKVVIIRNKDVDYLIELVDKINEKYGIPKRWRADDGENYFYIDDSQMVLTKYDLRQNCDDNRYSLGNYFRTKEEAEKVLKSKNWQVFWANVRAGQIGDDEE